MGVLENALRASGGLDLWRLNGGFIVHMSITDRDYLIPEGRVSLYALLRDDSRGSALSRCSERCFVLRVAGLDCGASAVSMPVHADVMNAVSSMIAASASEAWASPPDKRSRRPVLALLIASAPVAR